MAKVPNRVHLIGWRFCGIGAMGCLGFVLLGIPCILLAPDALTCVSGVMCLVLGVVGFVQSLIAGVWFTGDDVTLRRPLKVSKRFHVAEVKEFTMEPDLTFPGASRLVLHPYEGKPVACEGTRGAATHEGSPLWKLFMRANDELQQRRPRSNGDVELQQPPR